MLEIEQAPATQHDPDKNIRSEFDRNLYERQIKTLKAELGSLFLNALADPETTDLKINGDSRILCKQRGIYRDIGRIAPQSTLSAIYQIGALSNALISENHPIFAGEFPIDNSRMQIMLPPVVDAPVLILRTRARKSFTLTELVAQDVVTITQARLIEEYVRVGKKLVITGATGSGKTTFCNALLHEIGRYPERHLVLLEDEQELQPQSFNCLRLYAKKGFGRHADVQMADLVFISLRADPTLIAMGELREGKAAVELFKSWNTGHPGFTTYHADSATDALARFEDLIQAGGMPPNPKRIARTVNLIVHLSEVSPGVRRVQEVAEVLGYDKASDEYQLRFVP